MDDKTMTITSRMKILYKFKTLLYLSSTEASTLDEALHTQPFATAKPRTLPHWTTPCANDHSAIQEVEHA